MVHNTLDTPNFSKDYITIYFWNCGLPRSDSIQHVGGLFLLSWWRQHIPPEICIYVTPQKITISMFAHVKISDFVCCKTSASTTSLNWVSLNGEPTHSDKPRCETEPERRQRDIKHHVKVRFWSSIPLKGWRRGKLEHQVLARISFRSPTLHQQVVYLGYGKSLHPQLVPTQAGDNKLQMTKTMDRLQPSNLTKWDLRFSQQWL
jgi:hypothetical protein